VRFLATTAFYAAAVGTTMGRTSVLRIGIGTTRRTGTTILAFVLCALEPCGMQSSRITNCFPARGYNLFANMSSTFLLVLGWISKESRKVFFDFII
jgi:hypothetical protein